MDSEGSPWNNHSLHGHAVVAGQWQMSRLERGSRYKPVALQQKGAGAVARKVGQIHGKPLHRRC